MRRVVCVLCIAMSACSDTHRDAAGRLQEPAASSRPAAEELRQRALRLRNAAQQFDQEAATFRNEIPGGQPILQRKAVVADELRSRAAALEQKATMLDRAHEALLSSGPDMSQTESVNARFQHRHLAQELRQMAAQRRDEAASLSRRGDADAGVIAESRRFADQLDAIADEAEREAVEEERNIRHGMVPQ